MIVLAAPLCLMMINTLERPTNPFFAWRRPIRLMVWGSACVYYVTTSFLIIFSLIFVVVVRTPFGLLLLGSFQYDHE
jgi:hypothetical protein